MPVIDVSLYSAVAPKTDSALATEDAQLMVMVSVKSAVLERRLH